MIRSRYFYGVAVAVLMVVIFYAYSSQSVIASGAQTYSTPGTYTFTVPSYVTLTVEVNGAGGGGGGRGSMSANGVAGTQGTQSKFGTSVIGNGGGGGEGGDYNGTQGATGASGTASGGDTNVTGGGASGGSFGVGSSPPWGDVGGYGGNGGKASKTYSEGVLAQGSQITVVVGTGGTVGADWNGTYTAADGSDGSVIISWTEPTGDVPSSCNVTAGGTPVTGYAWSDTIGWIDLNCLNGSVCASNNFGMSLATNGDISGCGWSDNIGWISASEGDLSGCPQAPCRAKLNGNSLSGWLKAFAATALQGGGTPQTIFLTSGTSWTVPADWNSSDNTIETIGGGGSSSATGGGGGGAYSSIADLSLTPGASVTYAIGAGGSSGADGGSTFFGGSNCGSASVCAKGGQGTSNHNGGSGGSVSGGAGTTKYSGGNGGDRGSQSVGGGGGGAAGLHGAGGNGATAQSGAGGTGGGNGDAGYGGAGGNCGSPGQGGVAGAGGTEYDASHGSGGGGCGGSTTGTGGAGGLYGGGGGGGGAGNAGGAGAQGIVVITYTPAGSSPESGGWDGWISLSGSGYGPTLADGAFSGYAWGSDVVGWVDFSLAGTNAPGADACPNIAGVQQSVPVGYQLSGGLCINYCTPQTYCSGNDLYRNTIPVNTCVASLVETCAYGCSSGACIAPPPPSFTPFGSFSGHLTARPWLVRSGETTRVYWNVTDAASCTVTGSNGDSWSGTSSGSSGKVTSAITTQVTYVLACTSLPGAVPASITESVSVQPTPIFKES